MLYTALSHLGLSNTHPTLSLVYNYGEANHSQTEYWSRPRPPEKVILGQRKWSSRTNDIDVKEVCLPFVD